MTTILPGDPELAAMASVLKTLETLNNAEAQQRVLSWVTVRLGISIVPTRGGPAHAVEHVDSQTHDSGTPLREGTINTVVTKLGVNSCRTLLVAAAAYLVLYRGKEKFSRDELIACAKGARMWKSDYGVQTSVNINRMCDAGELIEKSKDLYDLSQKKLVELEAKLAE